MQLDQEEEKKQKEPEQLGETSGVSLALSHAFTVARTSGLDW